AHGANLFGIPATFRVAGPVRFSAEIIKIEAQARHAQGLIEISGCAVWPTGALILELALSRSLTVPSIYQTSQIYFTKIDSRLLPINRINTLALTKNVVQIVIAVSNHGPL